MHNVRVFRVNNEVPLPVYQTQHSAGCDAHSAVDVVIAPHSVQLVDTGLVVEVPEGYELQVRSRSGLALKNNIFVLNAPGCVDSDFRGHVGVILCNMSEVPFTIVKGDRIAQLILNKVERIEWNEVNKEDDLKATDRGAGGFGHTGV